MVFMQWGYEINFVNGHVIENKCGGLISVLDNEIKRAAGTGKY